MVPERKSDGYLLKDRMIDCESSLWSTAQRQKNSNDLMLMLGLNETID